MLACEDFRPTVRRSSLYKELQHGLEHSTVAEVKLLPQCLHDDAQ